MHLGGQPLLPTSFKIISYGIFVARHNFYYSYKYLKNYDSRLSETFANNIFMLSVGKNGSILKMENSLVPCFLMKICCL